MLTNNNKVTYVSKETKVSAKNLNDIQDSVLKHQSDIESLNSQIETIEANKATKEEVDIERQRINSLAKLEQGSTTGDAELIDGRLGADGVTYENLGAAIRTQFNNASGRLDYLESNTTTQDSRLDIIETTNTTQNTRLDKVEYQNKVQDTYISGLFNENGDKRLSIEGEGNDLKLEGSKEGLVQVDKIVGETLVNLGYKDYDVRGNINDNGSFTLYFFSQQFNMLNFYERTTSDKTYTVVFINKPSYVSRAYLLGSFADIVDNKAVITVRPTTYAKNYIHFYGTKEGVTLKEFQSMKFIVLEGDYTNKPIPQECFEGLKSTFEEGLVTEEMVEQGLEKAENLGKYKASVKVRGKNLFNISKVVSILGGTLVNGVFDSTNSKSATILPIDIKAPCKLSYTVIKSATGGSSSFSFLHSDGTYSYNAVFSDTPPYTVTRTYTKDIIGFVIDKWSGNFKVSNIQLEEGTVATSYEPYFERNETVYLNSPLLKGDEIVVKEDGLYHYHKMGKVVLDGSENWNLYPSYSTTNCIVVYYGYTDIKYNSQFDNYIYSDKFKITTFYDLKQLTDEENIAYHSSGIYIRINKTKATDITGFKTWLQANPTTVVYELAEPYYEKIADYPLTLEIPNNATLEVESVIPCSTLKATYTGSVPSIYALENTSEKNTEDIQDTQIAVDFLLMSNMPIMEMNAESTGLTEKGVATMGAYFASRIMKGYLDYKAVVTKYPEFKEEIDSVLRSEGREDLVVE